MMQFTNRTLIVLMIFSFGSLFGQQKPADFVKTFFEDFHRQDTTQLAAHFNSEAVMKSISKDENGQIKPAYFAKDSAIEKFIKIVEHTAGKIFLASDSREIKDMFKKRFPDKIVTLEHDIVLTYKCDTLKNYDVTREQRLACYIDWFLLARCKELYITAGNNDLTDLSTFGYSAGAYGRSNIHFVFN